jgi:hypothetical protein
MARPQQYRGNPELKQYILFDNFSGGMNTTSIDDQTYTNEFRLLKNVELKEQGRIQNRKGFGYFKVFNDLLNLHNINVFESSSKNDLKIKLVKVVRDTHNILDRMNEVESISDFNTKMLGSEYMFDLVIARTWKEPVTPPSITINLNGISNPFKRVINLTSLNHLSGYGNSLYNFGLNVNDVLFNYHNKVFYRLVIKGVDGQTNSTWDYVQFETSNGSKMPDGGFEENFTYLVQGTSTKYIPTGTNPYDTPVEILTDPDYKVDNFFADVSSLKLRNIANSAKFILNEGIYKTPQPGIYFKKVKLEEKITNINSFTFTDSIYFSIHDLINYEDHVGIAKVKISESTTPSEDVFELINNSNYHRPSPYELSYVGFNSLASNPFDFTSGGSVSEIRGVFITNYDNENIILSNIPTSGRFNLNIIYNGIVEPSVLKLDIYTEDGFGEKQPLTYVIDSNLITNQSSIIKYPISLAITDVSKNIFLKIYQEVEIALNADVVFETTNDLLAQFGRSSTGVDVRPNIILKKTSLYTNVYTKDGANTYGYKIMTLPSYTGTYTPEGGVLMNISVPEITNTKLVPWLDYINPSYSARSSYPEYKNTWAHALRPDGTGWKLVIAYFDENSKIPNDLLNNFYIKDAWTGGSKIYFSEYVLDISPFTPNLLSIYQVDTTTPTYYKLKPIAVNGNMSDFEVITPEFDEILSYIDVRRALSEEEKELSPIELEKIKIIEINNRAVIYSGNTILFSDMFNFKYFPNYNYIILPINGNDSIQRLAYFRGSWIIFTKERIYRMSGEFATADFKIVLINDSIGCVSPDSVRSINNNLIFMTKDGLYTIKQNYYMEGLENVEKIDKQVNDLIPYGENYESLIYDEQYWLIIKDIEGNYLNTIKMYYNMLYASKMHPYVIDEYAKKPNNLLMLQNRPYSIHEDKIYAYDLGYLDFADINETEAEIEDNMYKFSIITPSWSLGMPTHEKKFKNIYIKTDSVETMPVYITLYVDNNVWSTPYEFVATVNELGEIEYREILNKVSLATTEENTDNILIGDEAVINTIDPDLVLGSFKLGVSTLGKNKYQVHKVITSAKGKTLKIQIEQKSPNYFAIDSIGILYKLGKARESR